MKARRNCFHFRFASSTRWSTNGVRVSFGPALCQLLSVANKLITFILSLCLLLRNSSGFVSTMLRISCLALSRNNLRAQLYTKKLRGNWTELNNIFVFLRFNHKTTLTFKNKIEIFSSALNFFIFSFSLSLAVSSFFLLLVVPILC